MSDDLWGDLPKPDEVETPYEILKDQASTLYRRTNYKIEGVIDWQIYGKSVHVEFRIKVPSLNGFLYDVLSCTYSALEIYPTELKDVGEEKTITCDNAANLKANIGSILQGPRLRKAL